jgi:hypothetical protein
VAADNGTHDFTCTFNTAGYQSLTATDTVTATLTATASGIYVNGAATDTLSVAGFPSPSTAGVAGTFTVTALNPSGGTDTSYRGTVYFTSSDAQAALPANYTFTAADNGVHRFSATLNTAGTQSITASDTVTSTITGTQSEIVVNAASDTFSVTASPSSTTAGNAVSVTVTALTSGGLTDSSYRGTVHFTSSDSQAVLPADYTFTSTDAGVHTFTNGVTLKTAGNQTVTTTDTVTSSVTGSVTVTVSAAAASTLSVTGFPSTVSAGTAGTVTVAAKDAFGNTAGDYLGTVKFTSSDAQAVLLANYNFTTTDAGVHTFTNGVTLNTVGTQSITATDTVTSTITGTQSGISVTAATASSFSVTASSITPTAGSAFSITVTALSSGGSTDTSYTGTVKFSSSDTQAVLPANYTFTSADAGVHTFTNGVTLKTAGSQTVTATDTVTSSVTGSVTVTVSAAAASTLSVTGFPSTVTAGTAGTVTVTAKDAFGNTAISYTGTVSFTSSDAQAVLPANYTFVGTDAGVHTFTNGATLKTAGSQSLTATDTVTSSITGTESGITVNAAATSTLTVAGYPSPTTAGVANNFTVTAKDVYGNTATGYRGTVSFSSSDTRAGLPGPYTFTSTDSGVHTFSATLKTVGTQSITATDTHTSTITGTQSGITVNPASASSFTVTGFPSPIVAGTAGSFTVTAKDAFGNVATGYQGTVKFSSSDQRALLPANYTFTTTDAGVHTFTNGATLKTAGTQSITATDTVTSSIRGTQAGIVVNAAATSLLRVSGFPSQVTAGTAGSVTVTATDAYGNKTTGYTGTVHFTSTDSQAVLPADYTFTSTDAGVHTFTNAVTLKTAGMQSITATDTVTSSITGKQTVGVSPAAAASLTVSGYPSPTTAGVSHTFTVRAKDAYGNIATGYTGTVTFSSSDPAAVLPANYTFVSGDHGVHTFSATFKTVGTQSLTATDTVTSSITGTQSGIVVTAAPASVLVVSGVPSSMAQGASGSFTITAFTPTDAGVHTFRATLNTFGTQSITATNTVNSTITGTDSGIQVTMILADRVFRDWPSSEDAGIPGKLLETGEVVEQLVALARR